MDYQIAIDPSLGISTEDFVATWNKDSETNQHAAATLEKTSSPTMDGGTTAIILSFLAGMVANGLSNDMYNLIKQTAIKLFTESKEPSVEIDVKKVGGPNGTEIIYITKTITKN